MKIFLEFENENSKYKEYGYYEFNILSCCAPNNLWMVVDNGINDDEGIVTRDFHYRKVISLMEVSTCIQAGVELHGQVVTVALGNYGCLYNVVLSLGEDQSNFIWHQYEPPIVNTDSNTNVYLIDLDELHQSKEYAGLPLEECIKRLLVDDEVGYENHTLRSITQDGNILNVSERYIP